MRLTRFERKIVVALLAVGFMPLVAALVLGRGAVREAYEVGVNGRVRGELENALTLYTSHLTSLRDLAERTADAVARDEVLVARIRAEDPAGAKQVIAQLFEAYPNTARAQIFLRNTAWLTYERGDRLNDAGLRPLVLSRSFPATGDARLELTTMAPWAPFRAHQRAAEIANVYKALQSETSYFTATYLGVFIALLFSVIVVAVAVGIVLSRRVTKRVAMLAEATQRVGRGDLTVQVPADSRDEVGDLTQAFNAMVRDLRESQTRIEFLQRIGAWQQFARRLAHEIKNPLTPIQLAIQEVHTAYPGGDDKYKKKLDDARDIIEEEIATLRRLVGEFSAFAKLPKAELTKSDLGVFVHDLEKAFPSILEDEAHRLGAQPTVTVECESSPKPIPVRMDLMMMKRGVDNLVRNAVQACRGREGGRVLVRARRDKRHAILEVLDNGPGVPAEDRDRVFDPYFTTKTDGTGLGLPIVKKVVLEHDGDIECTSSDLGGACFRIRLPIAP